MRVALTLEYDGTDLCGWQRQANGPTVQEHLERALESMMGAPTAATGASRTDARVHARGQVAHADLRRPIPLHGLVRGLNGALPPSIAVLEAREVAADFHARFCARAKDYRYLIDLRPVRSPLDRHRAWHRPGLAPEPMRAAAIHLVGEHDFAAFRAAGCSARTTTRRIHRVAIEPAGEDRLAIDVRGNAFLRNMVRILAGTLAEVGRGKLGPGDIRDILASRDRARAGQTAPPQGLTLVRVHYQPPPQEPGAESPSIM